MAEKKKRGISHGTLVRTGDKWSGRWMIGGKRFYRSLGTFTGAHAREQAQAALDALLLPYRAQDEAEIERFAYARLKAKEDVVAKIENEKPAMLIADCFDAYEKHPMRPRRAMKDGGKSMMHQYRSRFERLSSWLASVHPEIREMRHITKEIAFDYLKHVGELVSANTYNKYLTFFSSMWTVLKEDAKLESNPWAMVRHVQQTKSVRRELTMEELDTIAQSASGEIFTLFAIGVYTGLRLGDAVRLDWSNVDLDRNHITVEPTKTERFTLGEPVVIPLVPRFRNILCQVPKGKRKGKIVPGLAEMYTKRESGKSDVSKAVQRFLVSCGIDTQIREEGHRARVAVGFHSLRHTFVSVAASSGIPLAVVQAIVGHSSPAMTQHYLHVSEKALQSHVNQFPAVFGASEEVPAGAGMAAKESATVARICGEVRGLSKGGKLEVVAACLDGMSQTERMSAAGV